MRVPLLLASIALSFLSAVAQSSQVNSTQATITSAATSASQSGSASASSSISGSANATASASGNITSTATTTSILPTAPSSVPGQNGGGANGGAPSPGASASNGMYGPPDGYIAAAQALRTAGLLGFVGFAVGGVLLVV